MLRVIVSFTQNIAKIRIVVRVTITVRVIVILMVLVAAVFDSKTKNSNTSNTSRDLNCNNISLYQVCPIGELGKQGVAATVDTGGTEACYKARRLECRV